MPEFLLVLSCGHLRPDDGRQSMSAVCGFCKPRQRREVSARIAGWSWACGTCHTSRGFGAGELIAWRKARAHGARFPTHVVRVMLGDAVKGWVRPSACFVELPLDEPPF